MLDSALWHRSMFATFCTIHHPLRHFIVAGSPISHVKHPLKIVYSFANPEKPFSSDVPTCGSRQLPGKVIWRKPSIDAPFAESYRIRKNSSIMKYCVDAFRYRMSESCWARNSWEASTNSSKRSRHCHGGTRFKGMPVPIGAPLMICDQSYS